MLLPKRVKYRRQHRGRMRGEAHKGNFVAYGDFGLQSQEASWITSLVISNVAARFGLKFSHISPLPKNRLILVWVLVRAHLNFGWLWLSPAR